MRTAKPRRAQPIKIDKTDPPEAFKAGYLNGFLQEKYGTVENYKRFKAERAAKKAAEAAKEKQFSNLKEAKPLKEIKIKPTVKPKSAANLGTKPKADTPLAPAGLTNAFSDFNASANPELMNAYIKEIEDELAVRTGLLTSRKVLRAPRPLDNKEWLERSHVDVQRWRFREMAQLMANPELIEERYKNDPISFICHWCDIFEPRLAGKADKPTRMPFIMFKRQEELLQFIHACVVDEGPGLVEKSRDMGATWVGVAYSVWMWRFHENSGIGWGSANAKKLDELGNPDSIFEKTRLLLRSLPKLFLPKKFTEDHMMLMRIVNPENGSTIKGDVGDNIGRGGRSRLYFVDEAAYLIHPEEAEGALSENTRVRIDISSVSGPGTVFHRTRDAGVEWSPGGKIYKERANVFIMDWSDHPEKTAAWAKERKATFEAKGLGHVYAREIGRNYAAALEGSIIKPEWIDSCIDADKKLGLKMDDGPGYVGLDIGDQGVDSNAMTAMKGRVIKKIKQWKVRDTAITARNVITEIKLLDLGSEVYLDYDCIGIGSGCKAEWNRLNDEQLLPSYIQIVPWHAGAAVLNGHERLIPNDEKTPFNRDFFANLKAQAWWAFKLAAYNTHLAVTEGIKFEVHQMISIDSKACERTLMLKFKDELSQAAQAPLTGKLKTAIDKNPTGASSPNMADSAVIANWPVPAEPPGSIGMFFAPTAVV